MGDDGPQNAAFAYVCECKGSGSKGIVGPAVEDIYKMGRTKVKLKTDK